MTLTKSAYKNYLKESIEYLGEDLKADKDPVADLDFIQSLVKCFHDKTNAKKVMKIQKRWGKLFNSNKSTYEAGILADSLFGIRYR